MTSENERKRNSTFVPVPKTGTIVPNIDDVLAILDETLGFASLSHGARNNLEEAVDILNDMRSSLEAGGSVE